MQYLLVLLALLISCEACYRGSVAVPQSANPIERMHDSTAVLIHYDDKHEIDGVCSAVFVSQIELVTAAHCTNMAGDEDPIGRTIPYILHQDVVGKDIYDVTPTGQAMVLALDEANDLALLTVGQREGHGVAPISREPILQGTSVWTLGHTFGLLYSLSDGVIGASRTMKHRDRDRHVLQVVCGASYGNSGGGVWDQDGELLGIASYRFTDSTLVFYTHRDEVLAFLAREGVDAL